MEKVEIFGLLGCNIGYSRSPEIFRELWKGDSTPREYRLIDLKDPTPFIEEVRKDSSWRGFSVTIPYKEWIIPHLDDITDVGKSVGAINAVRVHDGQLIGHNTDVSGFLAPLKSFFSNAFLSPAKRALVLGTGGAAKAVRYGLESKGMEVITISRSEKRGDLTYQEITSDLLQNISLIVNATPLGGKQYPDTAPPIPYHLLGASHLLYDLTYTEDSGFLVHAPNECQKLNGMAMLEAQAVSALHFFLHGNP